jgi:hypothetical protein
MVFDNRVIHASGERINLTETDRGLRIDLTEAGRSFMEEYKVKREVVGSFLGAGSEIFPEAEEIEFETPPEFILAGLLEDAEGIAELLNPRSDDYLRIGALTSSPIIASGVMRDDRGEIEKVDKVFWYPGYQVQSELEELLRDGSVTFERAE